MRCPICDKELSVKDNTYRPFCSRKCKLIDLGEWLEGGYKITGENDGHEKPVRKVSDEDA